MRALRYKNTLVASGSHLYSLIRDKAGASAIEKHYDETTKNCKALYGAENYEWFVHIHKTFPPENRKSVESNP
jgi:hypothetical protein